MFVFDRAILDVLDAKDDARVTFLHDRVTHLDKQARENGGGLWVEHGHPMDVLASLCDQFDVVEVHTNQDYEPYALERDAKVRERLAARGVAFHTHKDHVVKAPGEVTKPDGLPYTVFTPYSKRWHANLVDADLERPLRKSLERLDQMGWPRFAKPSRHGVERSAIEAPEAQVDVDVLKNYADTRDLPAKRGTTRISVHLRFGTVSIRELAKLGFKHSEKWLTELIWRDFYQAIIHAFPHSAKDAFRPQYDRIPWRHDDAHFEAWKAGKTGYPLVDAGMRELNATGFMHNRVRMVVASFFCNTCCWIGGWVSGTCREVARL